MVECSKLTMVCSLFCNSMDEPGAGLKRRELHGKAHFSVR
jgi:hypothetical protein